MSETLYYLLIGVAVLMVLMLFAPFRVSLLSLFGAKTAWSLVWSLVSVVLLAHWTVLRNFAPRDVVLPTLDNRKVTNAED